MHFLISLLFGPQQRQLAQQPVPVQLDYTRPLQQGPSQLQIKPGIAAYRDREFF